MSDTRGWHDRSQEHDESENREENDWWKNEWWLTDWWQSDWWGRGWENRGWENREWENREEENRDEEEDRESQQGSRENEQQQEETQMVHRPPGKGCRLRRRQERDTQLARNDVRHALGVPFPHGPIQEQINFERRVKQRGHLNEQLVPEVIAEAKSWHQAKEVHCHQLIFAAQQMSLGHRVPVAPAPYPAWMPRPSPPASSSSSYARPPVTTPVAPMASPLQPMVIPRTP